MSLAPDSPKIALLFGGTFDHSRRLAAQRGEKPRMNELEIQSQLGAQLYDFGWFKDRASHQRSARLLYWAANRIGQWSLWLALLSFWTMKEYDVVYATGEDVGLPLAALLRLAGKKYPRVIMRLEQPTYGRTLFRRFVFNSLLRFALKRIDLTLCRTNAHAQMLKEAFGASPETVVFTPETTDKLFFSNSTTAVSCDSLDIPTTPYIVSAGLEMRDYPTLIAAVRDLPVKVIIGAGSPWSKFRFDANSTPDLPDNVRVSSFTAAQMRELYRSAAFVVAPIKPTLRACGMNVVLEAWAMGRAVIASRTVGLTDYIQQNETGIFVEPSNVEDLRSKILYLLQQPDEATRLGQNGSKRVATDLNLERYIGILAAAIAKLRRASV
ncbi:MAG: glycosyltransferase family 4 protein [Roseiflexaceae bacterium]